MSFATTRVLIDSPTSSRSLRQLLGVGAAALFTLLATRPAIAQAPDSAAFERAAEYARSTGAQAVLVMHRGKVIHERYFAAGDASRRQIIASGSKSFVGVATLAAVADGLLKLDDPVSKLLAEWRADPRKSRVTVRQLLSLESGVTPGAPGTGCGGPRSTWQDAINAAAIADPGTRFAYGPFPFVTMGAAIERVRSNESFEAYLDRRIFKPLGITVEWRMKCADGKPQLAGGAAITARDWAIFGEFIRRGGVHDGKRLLADTLVAQLFKPSKSNPAYGMSWWLRGAAEESEPARGPMATRRAAPPLPVWVPKDLVMAAGAGKQRLYVIPSRELVIVRLGPVIGGYRFDDASFLGPLLASAPR